VYLLYDLDEMDIFSVLCSATVDGVRKFVPTLSSRHV
jgi:hypothetical protein